MIKTIIGDITKIKDVDFICSASNGWGCMIAGVSGTIGSAAGFKVRGQALKACITQLPMVGDLYITSAGKLPYQGIIHLVTMWMPGIWSSTKTVKNCLNSLIAYCKQHAIDNVAVPALGTGTGMLNIEKVAKIYVDILEAESINFIIVDIDSEFINTINKFLMNESKKGVFKYEYC